MIVNSFNAEFVYELISVLPYAYYLYLNNQLKGTISAPLTEPLYYFSPNHQINKSQRGDIGTQKLIRSSIPNKFIHIPKLDTSQFVPPPYKKHYANNVYKWDKPIFVIYNKYNVEWGKPPINYFSLDFLKEVFELLKDKYQVVYFGVDLIEEGQDDAHSMYLGDLELCKEYPEVIVFQNLYKESGLNWNELQLKVFANCENFLVVQGGGSILASYFGGKNIIYCKEGGELECNSYQNWYSIFGGSDIKVAQTYEDVIKNL